MAFSERKIIEQIRNMTAGSPVTGLIKGIGDDCSVFGGSPSGTWLISTDMLVDGIHFNRKWHPPRLLGRKSIAVNLSDIAAMGGIPRFVLIAMSLPGDVTSPWLCQWLEGVSEILAEYNCTLIGGDTVTGRELNISVTVLGEQHPAGSVYRSGAKEGDTVWVSGPLGSSMAGLAILTSCEMAGRGPETGWQELVDSHLNPVPQIEFGQALCASRYVTAMQDISDGVATDLSHICRESGVSALIDEDRLPSLLVLDAACQALQLQKLDCILRGGEDYQLVFTIGKGREKAFEALLQEQGRSAFPIGVIEKGEGLFLRNRDGRREEITYQGYEHLA
jgi:thiamine-monophosphate kinase